MAARSRLVGRFPYSILLRLSMHLMKKFLVLALFLLSTIGFSAKAQWSLNPDTPTPVADSISSPATPELISDGAGGYFVFWLDGRRSQNVAVYGQHLSSTGQRLWAAGGKKITNATKKIWDFSVIRHPQGDIFLSHNQGAGGGDTLYTTKIDTDGNTLWKTLISGRGRNSVIYVGYPAMIAHPGGVYIAFDVTYLGGAGGYRYHSVDFSGNRKFGKINGQGIPGNFGGPFWLLPGPNNGGLIVWRNSNGAGTHASARRFRADSTLVGTANTDIVSGTTGLNYDLFPISDRKGGAFIGIVENTTPRVSIKVGHIDTSLQHTFATPYTTVCSSQTSTGDRPYLYLFKGKVYVTWADNRPPASNYDIYAQAVDSATGATAWTANGVQVMHLNSYIPYPKLISADSGGLFVLSQSTSNQDFYVQRLLTNGQLAFSGYRLIDRSIEPFYSSYRFLLTGDAPLMAWRAANNKVYVKPIRPYLAVATKPLLASTLRLIPNPSSGLIKLEAETQPVGPVHIFDGAGREVSTLIPHGGVLDVSALRSGLYTARVETARGIVTGRFVRE